MAAQVRSKNVLALVLLFNRITKPLLSGGVPFGPNVLITVRGRRSGLPRTTPVTMFEYAGRRGIIAVLGDSDWARNLRAAGRATITVRQRNEQVTAVELSPTDAVAFIRDVLAPRVRSHRLWSWFLRNIDKIDIDNPVEAAKGRPIFEIYPLSSRD